MPLKNAHRFRLMFLLVPVHSCRMEASNPWVAAGEAIRVRRDQIGFRTAKALADQIEISARLLGDIENGRRTSYSSTTLARLEQALQWEPGAIKKLLGGVSPDSVTIPEGGEWMKLNTSSDGTVTGIASVPLDHQAGGTITVSYKPGGDDDRLTVSEFSEVVGDAVRTTRKLLKRRRAVAEGTTGPALTVVPDLEKHAARADMPGPENERTARQQDDSYQINQDPGDMEPS